MRILSNLFVGISVILLAAMCFAVGYNYRDMLCGIAHLGYSAPAGVAFVTAIPYALAILLCGGLAVYFRKKSK